MTTSVQALDFNSLVNILALNNVETHNATSSTERRTANLPALLHFEWRLGMRKVLNKRVLVSERSALDYRNFHYSNARCRTFIVLGQLYRKNQKQS